MTKISMKHTDLNPRIATLRNLQDQFINPARRKATAEAMKRVQAKMQEPGEKPSYPIRWDSEKQRRAFFATNGFGGGIPHKRTGAYIKAWLIRVVNDTITLFNNSKAAPFVGGGKSRIHDGRWNLLKDEWLDEWKELPEAHVKATQAAIEKAIVGWRK